MTEGLEIEENIKHTSRSLPLPEFKNLMHKKLKYGYKKPEGTSLGLNKRELNLAMHYYLIRN